MGKKKDKALKSTTKSTAVPTEKAEHENSTSANDETTSIEFAEHVTAHDVMELVDSLSHDLAQLNTSHQQLRQQIAKYQDTPPQQPVVFMIIALILGTGIAAVGYYSAKTSTRTDNNMDVVSTRIDSMKIQADLMNASMTSLSGDLNRLSIDQKELTANVSTIDQNLSQVTSDIDKINTNIASITTDIRRTFRPMDPRYPWR
ncbi:MAG: hypothetical protein HKP12_07185 [Gammaproteobacteria bacterium]|nr:hypothetical protein [Gammaproteobacteria bacterium]